MTVLNKSEISAVHGGMAVSKAICTVAEIIHMGSEGFSALQDAIFGTINDIYNKDWQSLGNRATKLVSAGIFLATAAIHMKKMVGRILGHQHAG